MLGESDVSRAAERPCEPGHFCGKDAVRRPCAPGRFGDSFALNDSACSGACAEGYYCPLGSVSRFQVPCGDPGRFCPEGSPRPAAVPSEYFSTGGNSSTRSAAVVSSPGHYALDGMLFACPAGFFGMQSGLASAACSGRCFVPGYYCPEGSTAPWMRLCGGDQRVCPAGSAAPLAVSAGFYTADYSSYFQTAASPALWPCPPGQFRNTSASFAERSQQQWSARNSSGAVGGLRDAAGCQLCPDGTYKAVAGDGQELCLACSARFAVSAADRVGCQCGEGLLKQHVSDTDPLVAFFNASSGLCSALALSQVQRMSERVTDMPTNGSALTRSQQFPCEPGFVCERGVRRRCPAGHFGPLAQETRPFCGGVCAAGFYCPAGSTSQFQLACGNPNLICPEGSPRPREVSKGFYSNEDEGSGLLRSSQLICPPGFFCESGLRRPCPAGSFTDRPGSGEDSCRPCQPGYFCEPASPLARQFPCGNSSVYCPPGSARPLLAHLGFYTTTTGVDAGAEAFWDPANSTQSVELPCEPGYFCIGGVKYPCPPGTFGWRYGMHSPSCGGPCAAGYYCPSYLAPQPAAPAYTVWPGRPQVTATAYECGSVGHFCPQGSSYPLAVSGGFYSAGGGNSNGNTTRSRQIICPAGSFCQGAVPYLCPSGTYGETTGLTLGQCTDACPAGYFCPSGSAQPVPCGPGEYSTGAAALCSQCPGGAITATMSCHFEKECCFHA